MAKGKKKTQPLSSTETDAGAHEAATQPAAQPAEDILGLEVEFTCSSCGSHLDPSKINEAKCWLCGADNFVNEAEAELERGKREAEKKEFCCPNPNCARPLELLRSSEKYCAGCGVPLEKATPDVWFRKCVEPALAQNAARLLTGRAGFIEAAWQMGLTKEAAEIRLDDYHASNGGAPVEQSGRKRLPEVEPVQPEAMPGATHTVPVKKSPTRPRVADPA
ncbi:MAG TPA: hypothetical protein VGO96_05870, partial [Pyrinomonadaceae bacterium]|nr:hypothetical protein [Pyrinomonadaceae bacterium]